MATGGTEYRNTNFIELQRKPKARTTMTTKTSKLKVLDIFKRTSTSTTQQQIAITANSVQTRSVSYQTAATTAYAQAAVFQAVTRPGVMMASLGRSVERRQQNKIVNRFTLLK